MFDAAEPNPPSVDRLVGAIRRGEVALFIGAGTSRDAGAPSAPEMARQLSTAFLDPTDNDYYLAQAAALVEAVDGRKALDEWMVATLGELSPSEALLQIPLYIWKAIYTVNFDTLVEHAYAQVDQPAQKLRVFYSDRDRLSDVRLGEVPLYKLHGSLNRANSVEGHLTITTEDHFRDGQLRRRLVGRLVESMSDLTVFYAGFAREDPDFVQVMLQVKAAAGELVDLRRAYALQPNFTEAEEKRWEQ